MDVFFKREAYRLPFLLVKNGESVNAFLGLVGKVTHCRERERNRFLGILVFLALCLLGRAAAETTVSGYLSPNSVVAGTLVRNGWIRT
jgi:hypothetical protein